MHPIFADEAVVVEFEEGRARRDDRLALKGAADRPAQAGIGRLDQQDIEGAVIIGEGSESEALDLAFSQIGSATCRERVCQSCSVRCSAFPYKKKKHIL